MPVTSPVRRLLASAFALSLAGTALVACSAGGDEGLTAADASCTRASTETSAADLVSAEGPLGQKPTIEAYTPVSAPSTQWRDIERGDGAVVVTDAQPVVLDVTLFSGATGQELQATSYEQGVRAPAPLANWGQGLPGIATSLECASAGSRVVTVLAEGDGYTTEVGASLGLSGNDTLLAVIDVHEVYPSRATGTTRFVAESGMPDVVLAPDGRPGVIIPDRAAPDELTVQVLKEGDGAALAADSAALLAYTGVTWEGRAEFDSTWSSPNGPAVLALARTVPGFAQALEGKTVGSQVLIVIPPELGYGSQGSQSVPPDSTLVFVVDILGDLGPVTAG